MVLTGMKKKAELAFDQMETELMAAIKQHPELTGELQESHVGAVIFQSESISRNGSKTRYKDQEGAQKKRRRIFDRDLSFGVTIGDYTDEAVETIYSAFLASLDEGIYVDGNYVPVEVSAADWVDSDDSILRAKVAMQVIVTFHGGSYQDTDFAMVRELRVESVGKEPTDGK